MSVVTTIQPAPTRQRIWAAVRILRTFTHGDVMATAEAGKSDVCRYLLALRHAGIIRVTHRANRTKRVMQTMQLVRDLGPQTPGVRRRDGAIYDPNAHQMIGGTDA